MKRELNGFCEECREITAYRLQEITHRVKIKDCYLDVDIVTAFCNQCGHEMNVPGLMDSGAARIDWYYRKVNDLVTVEDIKNLMEVYNVGKAPLSLALGFGEITITRYLQGQMPSKEYSDVIQKALGHPEFMIDKLNENREKIGETAYKKSVRAATGLMELFNVSEKMLSTISYIFEKGHEVTPLALQKLLYFIQGMSLLINRKPMFEEDCQAWAHGPVYRNVYDLFKTFKYNPIDDYRFAVFKRRFQNLAEEEKSVIDLVMDTFGLYSGKVLERITHGEEPWQLARNGYLATEPSDVIIEKDSILSYYDSVDAQYSIKEPDGLKTYIRELLQSV